MPYSLTLSDLESVTDVEGAFGTTRLLPKWEDIPEDFRCFGGNLYAGLVESLFYGTEMPECMISFRPEFKDGAAALNRCVRAHLTSFEPKHEHKIAGVGYMIAQVCELVPVEPEPARSKSASKSPGLA